MEFSDSGLYSTLRCPECQGRLNFLGRMGPIQCPIKNMTIICTDCGADFCIDAYVPKLLPKRLSTAIKRRESYSRTKRMISRSELLNAQEWIVEQLSIPMGKLTGDWLTVCREVAIMLRICAELNLGLKEMHELISILGSHLMAPGYKRYVADQMWASSEAVSYEKYEDIVLRMVVNGFIADNAVILVELGSGVGRLLHQYGSCVNHQIEAANPYRRHLPNLYGQDSIINGQNLKFILGIDFEWRMIQKANQWLRDQNLFGLVSEAGRIGQVLGSTLHPPLSFESTPYENTTKIVCILFQTLGNQTLRELQVDMLEKAWQLASPNGIVLVSVFNARVFEEQASVYYSGIRKSVGRAIHCEDGLYFSSKAVYSKWFAPSDLKRLFGDAGMKNFTIWDNGNLADFPRYDKYLNLESQRLYKRRAVIGVACSKPDHLAKVERLIESQHS